MLKFVDTSQQYPVKRKSDERKQDFAEIYQRFEHTAAREQAGRCSQCGVPYCQVHCPLSNNIPDWLMLVNAGRTREAYELSSATNTFPEICGRICPQDRLCEGNCVIEQADHGAVTIGSIEQYITETAFSEGWIKPIIPLQERDESVGIIGAGPAGLAAAEQLRSAGIKVTIYDRYDRAGGLLIYGIPSFKLEKQIVERRKEWLEQSGVTFVYNCNIGQDLTFSELRNRHNALLIATGVYKARAIKTPGSGLEGIIPALTYLTAANRRDLGDKVPAWEDGSLNAFEKDVVVIGGGDTAMDCLRTAVRQGANSVKCLYRRDRKNMPGSQREVTNAIEEGVEFLWLSAPEAFLGNGHVSAVRMARMRLGMSDASGRGRPEIIEGSHETIPADIVIEALGFEPENLPSLFDEPQLPVTDWHTLKVNWKDMQTSLPGVFAAGDIVRGASLVVWGIRDGRDAAAGILRWFETKV